MSQSHPVGDEQGPDVITVCSIEKEDSSFIKIKDNQQKIWNSANLEAVSVLAKGIGKTFQVKWQMMEGELEGGKTYQSKYINAIRPAPEGTEPQEYRAPFQGGGSGGSGGGGSKGTPGKDFRTREEIIACEALQAASRLDSADRKKVMETASVYYLWIIERGKPEQAADQWANSADDAKEAAKEPDGSEGWDPKPATDPDDDIPF